MGGENPLFDQYSSTPILRVFLPFPRQDSRKTFSDGVELARFAMLPGLGGTGI